MFTDPIKHSLTATEQRVLDLIGRCKTSKEIAVVLKISVLTVGNHRKSLCRKLDVHSTAELAVSGAGVLLTGNAPPPGTPCVLAFVSNGDGSKVQVTYRGYVTAKGGAVRVTVGDVSFNF